jgi:octaprenyl-diphosphate synthase
VADADTLARLDAAAPRGVDPARTQERLEALRALLDGELERLDAQLPGHVADAAPDVRAASRHLLDAGGKRLRPLLVLLAGRAAGDPARAPILCLAGAAELVHSATLLHDDVIDDGRVRRGVPAARLLWGNAVSVLGGDFLLARALELALCSEIPGALSSLLAVVRRMIDGEALQLDRRGRLDPDEGAYREIVDAKTAALFGWCGRAGALAAGAPERVAEALEAYGLDLGRAFQIVDDVLDLAGRPDELGKTLLADVREGKLTLPILYAIRRRPLLQELLTTAAENPELAPRAAAEITATGALDEALAEARFRTGAACEALAAVPAGPHMLALAGIARELTERSF